MKALSAFDLYSVGIGIGIGIGIGPSSHPVGPMRDTGHDMKDTYQETSRGGLAVNAIEC